MRCFIALAAACLFGLTVGHAPAGAQGAARETCRAGSPDTAIAACSQLIKQSPGNATLYVDRCAAHVTKSQLDLGIADCDEAIRLDPGYTIAYFNRGLAHKRKGDYGRAIADYGKVIQLSPAYAPAYMNRGVAYDAKGDTDRAIADFNEAIKLDPTYDLAYFNRGLVHERKGDRAKAVEDYNMVLAAPAKGKFEEDTRAVARSRLAALGAAPTLPVPPQIETAPDKRLTEPPKLALPLAPPPKVLLAPAPPDRRVALVIGNVSYAAAPDLPNARKDASDVAAALRDVGFAEVVEHYNLKIAAMRKALADFDDLARTADWAVVYFAGHGIEVGGVNYLVAVDTQMKRLSDADDEMLSLERVLVRVAGAKKLQLVILDACRDNPFAKRLTPPGGVTRSFGTRGLARLEVTVPNLMIAYAAAKGEVASEGLPGQNSPFAKALVKYLAEPQLELGIFFRMVRADVMKATNNRQRPFEDSSLIEPNLFFRHAAK